MGVVKVTLNGDTLIDITDTTVTAAEMFDDTVATGVDGEKMTGTYVVPTPRTASDVTVSGATVTIPSGAYASQVSKSVASATQATPSISVNSSTGLITASATQTAGYVSAGTKSNTSQLSTQAGTTIAPTESEQTAVAAGRYTTGIVKVGAISSTYVGSGITQRDGDDLSASGATVTAPAGYYAESASKSVASGTEGTPTATKGSVSNHSVTVTPSVTNAAGYIAGGTKTGTGVSVSASELVSGTYSVTSSGTKDVTNYASASVPAGTATTPATTITANPTINVMPGGYVSVSGSTSQSITPTVSAGYISNGTSGTVTASVSAGLQLPVYAGAHHSVVSGYTVTITLTNPSSASSFQSCTIFEREAEYVEGQQIGQISSPTGSTEVEVSGSAYGITVYFNGEYVTPPYNAQCTGGIAYESTGDGFNAYMQFTVTGNGTITIDGVNYDD